LAGIDLHAHTTASDGSLTPTELVKLAVSVGLSALAVTDHDTLDGIEEAEAAARGTGVEVVPGIELAVEYPSGRFHMLGYFIDRRSEILNTRLRTLKENRARRNERMVEKMRSLGLPITMDEIAAESGGGQIGRPHMVAALLKKGLVDSAAEAWEQYLKDGAAAHIPKDKIGLWEGIDLIHAAGGRAVMAHPNSIKLDDEQLVAELPRLRSPGLDGVECYYSQYSSQRVETLIAMARSAGLLPTGGSDFHGAAKPDVYLGRIYHDAPAPAQSLIELKSALDQR
jgi:predicted metal-dependent phosphoesterase TrpH